MRISTFIIAMIVVGLFVFIFTNFFAELNDKYTPSVDFNSSDWERYNQLAALKNNTESIQEKTDAIKEDSGVLDVIGSYFSSAYDAFKLTRDSYSSFEKIADAGIEDANLGVNASTIRTALITIVLVIILIGIVLSALLKTPV